MALNSEQALQPQQCRDQGPGTPPTDASSCLLFYRARPSHLVNAARLPRTHWWYDRAGPDSTGGSKRSTHALTKTWDAIQRNKNHPGKQHAIAKSYEEHMCQCRDAVLGLATAEGRRGFLERSGRALSGCAGVRRRRLARGR